MIYIDYYVFLTTTFFRTNNELVFVIAMTFLMILPHRPSPTAFFISSQFSSFSEFAYDMLYMISHNMLFGIAVNYTTQCQQHIEKCPVHLVSLIKHHGLFVPYIVANFTPPNQTFFLTLFTLFTLTHANANTTHPLSGLWGLLLLLLLRKYK